MSKADEMNKELKETINRLKILLKDSCDCEECMKNKKVYTTVLNYIENSISKEKVKSVLKDLGKEFNKLDEETDKYLKEENRALTKYYEQRERTAVMQTIGWAIGKFEELLEGK